MFKHQTFEENSSNRNYNHRCVYITISLYVLRAQDIVTRI